MPDSSMAAKRIIPPDEPSRDIANATAEIQQKKWQCKFPSSHKRNKKNELFMVDEEIEGQRIDKEKNEFNVFTLCNYKSQEFWSALLLQFFRHLYNYLYLKAYLNVSESARD